MNRLDRGASSSLAAVRRSDWDGTAKTAFSVMFSAVASRRSIMPVTSLLSHLLRPENEIVVFCE